MATYRGIDGEFTVGGTRVGEMNEWELNASRAFLEDTEFGDTARTGSADIVEASGRVRGHLDYGDAQQASVIDAMVGSGEPASIAGVFRVETGKEFSCSLVPTGMPITNPGKGGKIQIEFAFEVTGAISVAWA